MTTTTNIKLSTPAHGANVDTWDADPINNNSGILDALFGSVTSKALTNVDVTLSATEAQAAVLRLSGILTGNVAINVGAIIKDWEVQNFTTGAFVVTISGGSGNLVGVPQGQSIDVRWDGSNCYFPDLPHFIGEYWDDGGSAVPSWVTACTVPPYLLCDGSTFNASTYPYLNTKLGGNTLPDARGRGRFALNGGTSRITTAGSGVDGDTRFSVGGAQNVTLAQANLPNTTISLNLTFNNSLGVILGASAVSANSGASFPVYVASQYQLVGATGTTASINGGVTQTTINGMPPAYIGGIVMMRAA